MKKLVFLLILVSCKETIKDDFQSGLTLSFGSCNNQSMKNTLFKEVLKNNPSTFIWGGDIIYSDTDNSSILDTNFKNYKQDSIYTDFASKINIIGTWDDHDYGVNDGGFENPIKNEAQQIFLDFLNVSKNDKRRNQEGIYSVKTIEKDSNSVKIILLDTRFFRTQLTKDPTGEKRYIPNEYGTGTMLGEKQWQWLESELKTSESAFNVIVSSIQFLSIEHGYESWGTMPHEVDKLKNMILKTQARNVIILSGDRHISEISKSNMGKFKYPLIDFTSSGMTHAYNDFPGEENPFRVSNVIKQNNFGLLQFDFDNNQVLFEIRGENNIVLEQFTQQY